MKNIYVVAAFVVGITTLDLLASVVAKEWALKRSTALLAVGIVLYAGVFMLYARSMDMADMWLVSLAWIVLVQVGLMVVDRWLYAASVSMTQWLIVGAILALQGVLFAVSSE